jgi:uncharacterized protein (DUF305 family)
MPMMPGMEMPACPETAPPRPHVNPERIAKPNRDAGDGSHAGNGGGMDGTMAAQDMAALQNAQGVDASRLYLARMITHRQGAIPMAQKEIGSGRFPATIALARSIVESQQKQVETLKGILASR